MTGRVVKVDGTPYELAELDDRRWIVTLDSVQVGRPYRTRKEALSGAFARTGALLVGGGLDRSAA